MASNRDPVMNAIYKGIKRDIQIALENQCYAATVMLVYSGMDAMAFLNMPASQVEVKPVDFIAWADRYIKFTSPEKITGAELYGARCGMLHTYGVESRLTREKGERMIGYRYGDNIPPIKSNSQIANLVLLDIVALVDAFNNGVDKFLEDLFSSGDSQKKALVEQRLQKFVQIIPQS